MRRVAAIRGAVPIAPFLDGLRVCRKNDPLDRFLILRTPEAFRERRSGITAGLNGGPHLRRRRRLLVKMNQHGGFPSRSSLKTDLAMNKGGSPRGNAIIRDGAMRQRRC